MGNKILKIALPLILIGVIAFVIHRANKTFDASKPTPIEEFNFSAYIDSLIQSELRDKPYAQAKGEYRRIYDVIRTEDGITRTYADGSQQKLRDSFQYCYNESFIAYWPIYEDEVEDLFKSDWSNKTGLLDSIKAEAEFLKRQVGASHRDSLTNYIAYVNDYYNILAFAEKESKDIPCTSQKQYKNLLAENDGYKKQYPMNKNKALGVKLDLVPGKAKQRWESNVQWYVNESCKATDLETFLNGFKSSNKTSVGKSVCDKKIKEFCDEFNKNELSKQKTKLNDRWKELIINSVNEACMMDNYKEFYPVYTRLNNRIKEFENQNKNVSLSKLTEKLQGCHNEISNATTIIVH